MGHGCYYRLNADSETLAYWIEIDHEEEFHYMDTIEDIKLILLDGLKKVETLHGELYYGDYYKIVLRSTHHNDLLIDLELCNTDRDFSILAEHWAKHIYENKIIATINKYYPVYFATSAWTSSCREIQEGA